MVCQNHINYRSLLQNIISLIGLFCKKTYHFKEPTHLSRPIPEPHARIYSQESYTNDGFGNFQGDPIHAIILAYDSCESILAIRPIPWKMRLEMVIGMQNEILIGIMKLPFYVFFQIFKWKETLNNSFMIPIRISFCIPMTISSLIFHGTGCTNSNWDVEFIWMCTDKFDVEFCWVLPN